MEYEEIQNRLEKIKEKPVQGIPDDEMAKIRKKFGEKCPKSKESSEEFKKLISDTSHHPLVVQDPFPITVEKSEGTKVWDIDGNEYTDYLMSAGACILGHNYPPLQEKLQEVIEDLDPNVYCNTEWEIKALKALKNNFSSIERFQYFQSGSEADMIAARIARVYTGNEKIVKIGGAYHGWSDQFMYDIHIPHSEDLEAHGIPESCYKNTISVPPNDLEALEETLEKYSEEGSGVAAVFLEPLGPESGAIPIKPGFNEAVRELCDEYGALMVFDEVVTGFRMGLGGAQEYFDIVPDLTVLGKLLTHGYPSTGGVGGKKEIMEVASVGITPGEESAFVSGTIRANPLSTAATYWTAQLMKENNTVEKAEKSAEDFVKKLNDLFEERDVPYFARNEKSIVHFETFAPLAMDIRDPEKLEEARERKKCVDQIATALLSEGIKTKYGNRGFVSMQHTKQDNTKFVKAFEQILNLIPEH